MELIPACQYILDELTRNLSPQLTYHCVQHTLDVVAQSARLAAAEGITDPTESAILQTAAYYHDAGFIRTYDEHEEEGCRMAQAILPGFGYSQAQIEAVCKLIRVTKIPQSPESLAEQIICDADLDYLGRDDYPVISQTLYTEWIAYKKLPDPARWLPVQVSFLGNHRYFTQTNQLLREPVKQQALEKIKALLAI
ncbi:HD domain-containing protein [Arsenicibacter rosenii]|uniref:Metal-dependent phosphohydrolase n=1 Tax=Arsenicibacter rosenii TaxID=1750698 RepID=A0A1S2VLA1_9BACT|nr:HD domain-containing protein [Arsenicibacter rosenii]OIN59190.1 metal-dependent phosphohydrolase [Arsenicibacter rosenii]